MPIFDAADAASGKPPVGQNRPASPQREVGAVVQGNRGSTDTMLQSGEESFGQDDRRRMGHPPQVDTEDVLRIARALENLAGAAIHTIQNEGRWGHGGGRRRKSRRYRRYRMSRRPRKSKKSRRSRRARMMV
jgi:hypothetical protein